VSPWLWIKQRERACAALLPAQVPSRKPTGHDSILLGRKFFVVSLNFFFRRRLRPDPIKRMIVLPVKIKTCNAFLRLQDFVYPVIPVNPV
jgi:hypothetical protein